MAAYMKTGFRIHDYMSPKTVKLTLDALIDETLRASSAASGWAGGGGAEQASAAARQQLPILHLWGLNIGGRK